MDLVIKGLNKKYNDKIAVSNIDLHLQEGVNGLLGANGAGKTTLMRMICGIIKPDSGSISFNGIDVKTEDYRAELGYLPQDFGYYPNFTALDFMMYMGALKGMGKSHTARKTNELLETVGLIGVANKKIKTYSGGMKQRVGIAQALLNDPKILIVDEPTSGLDPAERKHFRELIVKISANTIVLLSTHIVSDVEHIADRVIMMKNGELLYNEKWDKSRTDLESLYMQKFGGTEND